MEYHEYSKIFPLMHGQEFEDLKQDIARNGQHEPIWLYENKILDGRNRFRACTDMAIQPNFTEYLGHEPAAFAFSLNMKRRHLTSSQRAAVAVDFLPALEKEAKERQLSTLKQNTTVPAKIPERSKGDSRDIAAKIADTSPRYVSDAKKLKEERPEIFDRVKSGEKTLMQAKREIQEERREDRRQENREKVSTVASPEELVGSARFPTIVIDPPWDWADEGDINQMGRAKPDYATLGIQELMSLPVSDIANQDSVLFMWATSPKLAESFEVLKAWGSK